MLSRFFSTSQPFHYLMGILLLSLGSVFLLVFIESQWKWEFLIYAAILPLILLLVQFIIVKNELTGQNSYGLFATTMLLLTMVITGIQWQMVACLFLLLLSLRRLLSLKKGIDSIRKIFDGSFWISIAVLIEPLMLAFFIVVFAAVFLFARNKWNHWVIPFVAISCVALLAYTIELYVTLPFVSSLWSSSYYKLAFLWDEWAPIYTIYWLIAVAATLGLLIYIFKLVDIQQRVRPRFSVLVFSGICALAVTLLLQFNYVLLLIPSLAIFLVRSIEVIKHKMGREFLFVLPVLLMILALLLR
ncbi:hypothetical protein SAMN05192588_2287 [Nonlabens sp. Hel1_33_55]|uniref:hypothetical protein n=1 Tax=Nonlabens sp. Hel1_33_55 TaxID=1336802 RepID=UPI000875D506|nr:hypothetical protein [Nonlabens sp. Hel1_33_55]SCY32838.1 hypothetical protein SAMN05192588_2287 [Nonlabens sp. Hel1_33_55]